MLNRRLLARDKVTQCNLWISEVDGTRKFSLTLWRANGRLDWLRGVDLKPAINLK